MHFTKMHGAGNDFIIIQNIGNVLSAEEIPALVRKLCAQHTGIGADGLMLVSEPLCGGDYRMTFYNSDGSEGEMCGNGARCIARYGYEKGLAGDTQRIETVSGTVIGHRISESRYQIRLNDAGVADFDRPVTVAGNTYNTSYIELGTPGLPHAVVRMDNWSELPKAELRELGRALRWAKEYPKGANVSFAALKDIDQISAVTFERGVEDFTLACGTGCGSIVSAFTKLGLVSGKNVSVTMPGGILTVSVDCTRDLPKDIFLTGPACLAFEGEILECGS